MPAFHTFQEFCNCVGKNKFIKKGLGDTEELWGPKEVKFNFLLHCSWRDLGRAKVLLKMIGRSVK